MNRTLSYIVLIGLLLWAGCAPKTIPTVTEKKVYEEDLSVFRPEIPVYEEPTIDTTDLTIVNEEIIPVMDVTGELSILLDSISKVNLETEFYEYTVQVHIGNNREEADEARLDVIRVLPEVKPKLEYKSPSYRVKVGRYFNNVEAYQTYVKLKEQFPSAIIVPERVYFR